jgi:cytochrome P450
MTQEEIKATSGILIIAGSETTATLLSGATLLLLKNPAAFIKAVDEVRMTFHRASEITFAAVNVKLPYLNACLEEALRLYPPVPSVLPRRTGPEGDIINGRFVPPDVSSTSVSFKRA